MLRIKLAYLQLFGFVACANSITRIINDFSKEHCILRSENIDFHSDLVRRCRFRVLRASYRCQWLFKCCFCKFEVFFMLLVGEVKMLWLQNKFTLFSLVHLFYRMKSQWMLFAHTITKKRLRKCIFKKLATVSQLCFCTVGGAMAMCFFR